MLEFLDALARAIALGARLGVWPADASTRIDGLPRRSDAFDVPRLAWWPSGPSAEPLVGLASSRLPRALDTLPELFRQVREAIRDVAARGERLAIVESMAASGLILRAAEVNDLPVLRVAVAPDTRRLAEWLRSLPLGSVELARSREQWLYLSPPIAEHGLPSSLERIPAADRVLLTIANRLDVLSLRRGGAWQALLRHLSGLDRTAALEVRLATHPSLVRPQLFGELVPRLATAWELPAKSASNFAGVGTHPVTDPPAVPRSGMELVPGLAAGAILPVDAIEEETDGRLIHFTRRCDGPWPGQSWDEYWDELLEERPERDRSALAVLCRILQDERILASNQGIRGKTSVVCWSAVPLDGLAERRVWRRHRRRWDFEPYGLAIRRGVLESLGARPVLYGDDAQWDQLPVADRPFFQKSGVSIRPGAGSCARDEETSAPVEATDWRDEREWRVLGDVGLANIATRDALVFVPNEQAARVVARVSRFRIAILKVS